MLLELLCAALNKKQVQSSLFESLTEKDWKDCFAFAKEQGVMALAWDGILSLPDNQLPPRQVKLPWALEVEKYERRYAHYVQTVADLTNLYAQHGIATVQLKGVGFSACYPVPEHREGGDIDIYTFSADKFKMSDEEANVKSNQLIIEKGIKVDMRLEKHSEFFYHGVPVENHKYFLETDAIRSAVRLDTYLKTIMNPCTESVLDGAYNIVVPSVPFNTLFIAYHAIQHYGNGLCLHHLCDWACLLNRYGLQIPDDMKDKNFLRMIYVFTQFTNQYLGTSVKVNYSEELLKQVTAEILHPAYPVVKTGKGVKSKIYKIKSYYHKLKLRKEALGEPICNGLFHSVRYHIQNPLGVFDK